MALATGSFGSTLTLATPIALTTAFVPAPSCLSNVYQYFPDAFNTFAGYYLQLGAEDQKTKCLPSGWAATSQYFSPGICPTGYSQACWVTSSVGTDIETLATCCPSGYTCATLPSESYATWLPALYATQVCVGTGGEGSSLGTFPVTKVTDGTTVVSDTILSGGVNAYGVSNFGSWQRLRLRLRLVVEVEQRQEAHRQPQLRQVHGYQKVLRDSQQVGAGTAALGVALLALLAWFALRRRKRARVLGDETQQYHDQPAMYGKPSIYGSVPNSELADPEIFEPEMGTGHATGELPGHGALATRPGRGDVHELG